uniref:Uncharacterized protein n=1 Tax=Globodera rostochiensis TaxID=31243 RepID=A0A914H4G2_GLORO
MSNHLKKSPRKDGIVAKLHIEKNEELISGEGGHTFRPILTNHKKMWEQFLDADGLNKRRQMLAENEYFSANDENLPSFDDLTSSAEEKDEFEDANLEQYFQQEQIKHQIMEENNENIFHENKLRTKWKNKTKNYYGKKEKRKENLSAEKLAETGEAKVTNYQTKAQKYLKISKNKERNKKN